jgi:hypothetical protein
MASRARSRTAHGAASGAPPIPGAGREGPEDADRLQEREGARDEPTQRAHRPVLLRVEQGEVVPGGDVLGVETQRLCVPPEAGEQQRPEPVPPRVARSEPAESIETATP